jgi:hypothetical protein
LSKDLARYQRESASFQAELIREQVKESARVSDLLRQLSVDQSARATEALSLVDEGEDEASVEMAYDAFVCHASEDKPELVSPLVNALSKAGLKIWYDEFELRVGDSLRRSIDRGLSSSRFGIVVLSPAFFARNWPQYELDGLVAREMQGTRVVLPLWHRVTKEDVMKYSPSLADRIALSTALYSVDDLTDKLAEALKRAE